MLSPNDAPILSHNKPGGIIVITGKAFAAVVIS
ncbi:MAG: hypothetical protein ACJAV0_000429 [Shewanella sp.]|jgi:hypothetical protein